MFDTGPVRLCGDPRPAPQPDPFLQPEDAIKANPLDDQGRTKFFIERCDCPYEELVHSMTTGAPVVFPLMWWDDGELRFQRTPAVVFLVNGGSSRPALIASQSDDDLTSYQETWVGRYSPAGERQEDWPEMGRYGYFVRCDSLAEGVDAFKELWMPPLHVTHH